tara:strand:+ start:4154 stop:4834 length:681 start_codon:yes stop_codon:yes gene_type:complete
MQCNAIVLKEDNYLFKLMDIKLVSILFISLGLLYFLGKKVQEFTSSIQNHLNWIILQNNEILTKIKEMDKFELNEPDYLPTELKETALDEMRQDIIDESPQYLSTEMNDGIPDEVPEESQTHNFEEIRNELVREESVRKDCIHLSNKALDENCNAKSTASNYKRIVNNIIENANNNVLEMIRSYYTGSDADNEKINEWIVEESKKGKVRAALLKAFIPNNESKDNI